MRPGPRAQIREYFPISWKPAPGYPAVGIPGGTTATPSVQLSYPGTYQLILTVTDATGATATATITLVYS
jgi:hypothetical protein